MLYYDRIDFSEGIDVSKTSASKDYIICQYQYFLDKGFNCKPVVCNWCHDVLIISQNRNYIAILNIHGVDYGCIINEISKSEATDLEGNAYLSKESESSQNIIFLYGAEKINKEIIVFGKIEVEKFKFHHRQNLILLEGVDIDNISISSMVSSG